MAVNQLESGQSVYIPSDYEGKANEPLFLAVRELIKRYSTKLAILELGGGPLVSTGILHPEVRISNLELDTSLLQYVKEKFPTIMQVQVDLEDNLPLGSLREIDVVVALDIFDHLAQDSVVSLLQRLKELKEGEGFVIIVSMPVISSKSIPCFIERLKLALSRRENRPRTGLFDITHKILTNIEGHKEIFELAGYEVIEEYRKLFGPFGITGDWSTPELTVRRKGSYKARLLQFVTKSIIAYLAHPLSYEKRIQLVQQLFAYQGLYVIGPLLGRESK